MKFSILFASVSLLLSARSFAAPDIFNGVWQGKGTYVLRGTISQCSDFNLIFTTTEKTIEFTSGYRVCDNHSEKFYKVGMDFRDGKILFQNEVVGTYTDNKVDVHYTMPDGNSHRNWRMSMRREGNNLVYEESRTMDGENTPMISFAGVLTLQKD